MTIIKKELSRFFGDRRLVFTVVLMPGLMIFFMYSLMGTMFAKEFSTADDYVAKAYVQNLPEQFREMSKDIPVEWTDWDGSEAEAILKEIEDGGADLLVTFPENFWTDVEAYEIGNGKAPNVEIYYNSAKSNSYTSYDMLIHFLAQYEKTIANKYDINKSDDEETGSLGKYDVAPKSGLTGKLLSGMLPMLIITLIFSGVQGVAPESIAGEKERGTIATLLVTPAKRSAIALGKVVSLSLVAILSGLSSFLGTILSLPKMMSGSGASVELGISSYGVADYLLLFAVILSTVILLVAIVSIISANANSVKEATTMLTPFMVAVMIVSLLPMLGMDVGGSAAYFIPLFNSVKSMAGIFGFEPNYAKCGLSIAVNFVASGVLIAVLTKMFDSEKVMFSK
jgi:sodium transport system permease protein